MFFLAVTLTACSSGGGGGGQHPTPPVSPTIITQPQTQSINACAITTFTVAAKATPSTDTLTYQWKVNKGPGFVNVTAGDGTGGSTPSFTTVIATPPKNGYLYQCVVTDPANGLSTTTTSATLTLLNGPLKVVGRFLQDANCSNIMMRGVNVPVYQSGWADDLNAVTTAVATTKVNIVRLEWWANPPAGTIYTVANLDRAIQTFTNLGILPIVYLADLTYVYGQNDKTPPNNTGNDQVLFASTITAFWTRADVLAVLKKHQNHMIINIANEWGSSTYSDGTSTAANFIQNYSTAITAMRSAGINAPLMVDAPEGFEYQFILDNGQAILNADPQGNTMLSVHAYWAADYYTDAQVNTILNSIQNSGLPIVLGEVSSNAYTTIPCDPIDYANLLTTANTNQTGYLIWAWYQDGQCGQLMNITVNADGTTVPSAANPGFGYDVLFGPGYGINTALPATAMIAFH